MTLLRLQIHDITGPGFTSVIYFHYRLERFSPLADNDDDSDVEVLVLTQDGICQEEETSGP